MKRHTCWTALLTWVVAAGMLWAQTPVGTEFDYQGKLLDGGSPANGLYDFEFVLCDAESGGNQVGPTEEKRNVSVMNGLFTVELNFGDSAFAGEARWLEIRVRPGGSSDPHTTLGQRQELKPTPNALSVPWSGLSGVPMGFADDVDDDTLSGLSCTDRRPVAKWKESSWVCASDADSGGDITSVSTGDGLAGGGTSGDITLSVAFSGSGTANTVSRGDHDHLGQIWVGSGYGLQVITDSDISRSYGVMGYASAASGAVYGIYGWSDSSSGRGVRGTTTATSGINFGVQGSSSSTSGFDFYAYGAGTDYGSSSSIRWKRDIRVIDRALYRAQQLRGVYFTWDEEHGGHHDVGMVAEEVGKVLPEIVQYEENGNDAIGMDYSRLTPLLLEAIKEQHGIVEEQHKLIADLQRRVAVLEQKIE